MTYLEEAAAQFRLAIADNEKRAAGAAGRMPAQAAGILAEVNRNRAGYAAGLTRIAAIEAGLPPCLGHDSAGDEA